MKWALRKWTNLDVRDYVELLNLSGEYTVRELQVKEGDWLAGKTLRDCQLTREGTTVLGIYRHDGRYVGAPKAQTPIYPDDVLVLYGRPDALANLDVRRADLEGGQAHEQAVSDQEKVETEQDIQEQEYHQKRAVGSQDSSE